MRIRIKALFARANLSPEERADRDRQVLRSRFKVRKTARQAELAEEFYWASRTPAYKALMQRRIRIAVAIGSGFAMLGFGLWSGVGVQHAIAPGTEPGSIEWALGAVIEPILLGVVGAINIVRAVMAIAGARLPNSSWAIEFGILSLSLGLNIHALPDDPAIWDYFARLPGPVGCFLVSIFVAMVERGLRDADITITTEMDSKPRNGPRNPWSTVLTAVSNTAAKAALRRLGDTEAAIGVATDSSSDHLAGYSEGGHNQVAASGGSASDHPVATAEKPVTPQEPGGSSGHNQVATTGGSTSGHNTGATPATTSGQSGHNTETGHSGSEATAEQPKVRGRMKSEEALRRARNLPYDVATAEVSERQLAGDIGCSRKLAGQVRETLISEHAASSGELLDINS